MLNKLFLFIIWLLGYGYILSLAFEMISSPNSTKVIVGISTLLGTTYLSIQVFKLIFKSKRK